MDGHSEKFSEHQSLIGNVRRFFFGLAIVTLVLIFILWQIQNERLERVRSAIVGSLMPAIELGAKPLQYIADATAFVTTYLSLTERLEELEQETKQLTLWKERARVLERENARLRDILNTSSDLPAFVVSARVIADTSSQFRFSVLLDVGTKNGVGDGWAVMDGSALAGRISGVARKTARVVLLVDSASQVPIKIVEQNSRGIMVGDGARHPQLKFASATSIVPGDKIVTSGDGGVYPPDLLIGDVVLGQDQIARVRLLADVWNLEYVSLLRPDRRATPPPADVAIIGRNSDDQSEQ